MATKPKAKPDRKRVPLNVTLAVESHEAIESHQAANPNLWTKSAALDDLIRIAKNAKKTRSTI